MASKLLGVGIFLTIAMSIVIGIIVLAFFQGAVSDMNITDTKATAAISNAFNYTFIAFTLLTILIIALAAKPLMSIFSGGT